MLIWNEPIASMTTVQVHLKKAEYDKKNFIDFTLELNHH